MRPLKHLPVDSWPEIDRKAFRAAFAPGDLFDDHSGPGAHLAEGSRRNIVMGYRRWLAYLQANNPDDILTAPAERITLERVQHYVNRLQGEVRPTSTAMYVACLFAAARLVAPKNNWAWLAAVKERLLARARPQDRFERLVPGHQTLDLGLALMDDALASLAKNRDVKLDTQYRDGLLLALVSLWLIRRRSLAALTVTPSASARNKGA